MNFKKIFSIIIATIIVCASFFTVSVSAAEVGLHFSSSTVEIGNKFVVTVTVSHGDKMNAAQANVTYNNEVLKFEGYEFVSCDGFINVTAPAGAVPVVFNSLTGKNSFKVNLTFTTIKTGSSAIAVKDCKYTYQPSAGAQATEVAFNGQSATMNVIDKKLPNNANLSSLTFSTGKLSPALNNTRTNYTVSVPYEAANLTVYAKPADTKAKVDLSPKNPVNLNVGANTIKLTVTAQDGTQKIYTIVVTRREEGATEEPEEQTPPTPENPYQTVISGKNYEIVTTLPQDAILKGFTETTIEYNSKQIPVLRDKENIYTVYYLREVGTTESKPYIYNENLQTFEALKYINQNDKLYIFADFPDGVTMPEKYYSTYTQISDYSVKAYLDTNAQMNDFAYVYCFVDGDFGLYRYDNKEGSIQRFPDIYLVDKPVNTQPNDKPDNFVSRFSSLSTNGKVLVISMLVAALCVILLIVFIIIMAIKRLNGKNLIPYGEDLDFDDFTIVGDEDNLSEK